MDGSDVPVRRLLGPIDRREFLRRAAIVALSAPVTLSLLNASYGSRSFAAVPPGGTLTLAIGADAAQLTPHVGNDASSEAVRNALYDNIVAFDAAGSIVPQLAT